MLHRLIFRSTACFMATFLALSCFAQENFDPPIDPPIFYAYPTSDEIALDGKLSEESWRKAKSVKDFFRMEPRQGGRYRYETEVKVVFDSRNLYFGVFCKRQYWQKRNTCSGLPERFCVW